MIDASNDELLGPVQVDVVLVWSSSFQKQRVCSQNLETNKNQQQHESHRVVLTNHPHFPSCVVWRCYQRKTVAVRRRNCVMCRQACQVSLSSVVCLCRLSVSRCLCMGKVQIGLLISRRPSHHRQHVRVGTLSGHPPFRDGRYHNKFGGCAPLLAFCRMT